MSYAGTLTDSETFTLRTRDNSAPIVNDSEITVDEGTAINVQMTASDSDTDQTITWADIAIRAADSGPNPPMLSLDSTTGLVTGTAPSVSTDSEVYVYEVTIEDELSAQDLSLIHI